MSAETTATAHEKRLVDVERLAAALSGEVKAIHTQLDSTSAAVQRIEQSLISLGNKPVNVTGWVGIGLSFITLWAGSVGVAIAYSNLSTVPFRQDVMELRTDVENMEDRQATVRGEQGAQSKAIEVLEQRLSRFRDDFKMEQEKIDQSDSRLSALEADLEAAKEHLDRVDAYGSRRWIKDEGPQ